MTPVAILTEEQLVDLVERAVERVMARGAALGPALSTLSTAQAAQLAGVTAKTVREWISSGDLPAGRRGRARVIRRTDLDAYLAGQRPTGSGAAAAASLARGA